eukprot:5622911-Pyramimonas_sp.AAC.1
MVDVKGYIVDAKGSSKIARPSPFTHSTSLRIKRRHACVLGLTGTPPCLNTGLVRQVAASKGQADEAEGRVPYSKRNCDVLQ